MTFATLGPTVGQCQICLESLNNEKETVIYHREKQGRLHPFHRNCLKGWFAVSKDYKNCPTCRIQLNFKDLFTPQEKAKLMGKAFARNAICIGTATNITLRVMSFVAMEVPKYQPLLHLGTGLAHYVLSHNPSVVKLGNHILSLLPFQIAAYRGDISAFKMSIIGMMAGLLFGEAVNRFVNHRNFNEAALMVGFYTSAAVALYLSSDQPEEFALTLISLVGALMGGIFAVAKEF